jgi:hypothetical protein
MRVTVQRLGECRHANKGICSRALISYLQVCFVHRAVDKYSVSCIEDTCQIQLTPSPEMLSHVTLIVQAFAISPGASALYKLYYYYFYYYYYYYYYSNEAKTHTLQAQHIGICILVRFIHSCMFQATVVVVEVSLFASTSQEF